MLNTMGSSGQVKPAVLAASVITSDSRELGQVQACIELVAPQADYSAFMLKGGSFW